MAETKIQWTEQVWNCIGGCEKVSPGCKNCYAIRQALRLGCNPNGKLKARYEGLTIIQGGKPNWTGATFIDEDVLLAPLKRRKPTTYFISLSDLFYDQRPDEDIDRVFAVMTLAHWHTFQILTKYAERIHARLSAPDWAACVRSEINEFADASAITREQADRACYTVNRGPLPNVWLGVSVESQQYADERIPLLLKTPAALRFVSYEPALGPVDFTNYLEGHEDHGVDLSRTVGSKVGCCTGWTPPLDWIIVGGESGPGARPFDVAWAWTAIRQCRSANVPCFLKQLGSAPIIEGCRQHHFDWGEGIGRKAKFSQVQPERENAGLWRIHLKDKKGGDMAEWAEHLRVRQMPEVRS